MTEEIETVSWGSRIKDAFIGVFVGLALIIGAIILTFWNEQHNLHTIQSLGQAEKILVSVPNSPIKNQNNLKLIYVVGLATTKDKLDDVALGESINAIKIDRTVEMYQWQEHIDTKNEKQVGGSEKETKTFTYKKVWSDHLIDSADFKVEEHHQNPKLMPLHSSTQYAKTVTLGDFLLPEALIKQINVSKQVSLGGINKDTLQAKYNKPVLQLGDQLFLGQDMQNPALGDLRIGLTAVYPQTVSIIAQQTNNTLQAYSAPPGESLLLLSPGEVSSDQMIRDALSENTMWTWLFRLASLIMFIAGFALIFKPLVVLADVFPFIGAVIGFGTGFLALIMGLGLWILFIAMAWFSTRPLLSIGLTLVILIGGYVLIILKAKKKSTTTSTD